MICPRNDMIWLVTSAGSVMTATLGEMSSGNGNGPLFPYNLMLRNVGSNLLTV